MTVNELAKRLGMNRRYVNQVVTGSKPGSYHLYVRIAEALDVPLAALFDDYPQDHRSLIVFRKDQRPVTMIAPLTLVSTKSQHSPEKGYPLKTTAFRGFFLYHEESFFHAPL